MKAITILQPYAQLIACGAKRFETRSWKTDYRGPIAIHAGKREFWSDDNAAFNAIIKVLSGAITPEIVNGQKHYNYPFGAVVATAELVSCYEIDRTTAGKTIVWHRGKLASVKEIDETEFLFGDYTLGRYAWELANVKPLKEPIPCKGRQGLWNWEEI